MRRLLPVLFTILFVAAACVPIPPPLPPDPLATPTAELRQRLPLDPAVRTGKLDNGLTYYVRQNSQPAQRAELRLIVNAGSVMEEEDEQGLAHFLEHMMFKGTERFPGPALLDFLESIGMKFGPDLNAYTSFDETVYMLQVPTEKQINLAKALDVLRDWAGSASLSVQDVDKERGVIVEEWRLGEESAAGRMEDKIVPMLLGASQYARRLPIGDIDVIRSAPVERLREFYRKWYRPDLMAVVAVGDFDVEAVEALIRERFGNLPNPSADALARPSFDVPARPGTHALVVKDPENPYLTLSVYQSRPARPFNTVGHYRDYLVDGLVSSMLNQRYDEVAQQAGAPFLFAYAGGGSLVRPTELYDLSAIVDEEKALAGLDALLAEFERARQHGFTEGELQRAKLDVLRAYQSADKERETSESRGYADEYVGLFLAEIAAPGIAYEHALVKRLLPGVRLDEANRWIADLVAPDNRAIIVQAPDKADLRLPSEAELIRAVESAGARKLEPYVDRLSQSALMEAVPAPVAIVDEKALPLPGVTEFTLGNGVRVIMKPTTFRKDEVLFSATSPGGDSLVTDEDYPEATLAASWIQNGGVGSLTEVELGKLLAGKIAGASPVIGELGEGFSGGASPDDLETALQLVYLYATAPRNDPNAFQVLQDQMRTGLKNRTLEPESALDDALAEIFCGTNVRCRPLTLAEVDALDRERAYELYRERFADFSDFTFTFVGNFDPAELKRLAQIYLGNLPSTGRTETWRDVRPDLPAETIERTLRKGKDQRAITHIEFTGPITPTLETEAIADVLGNVLDMRVVDELRQKLGATYSPEASFDWSMLPEPTYSASFDFVSDPKRAEELSEAVFTLLDRLRDGGPAESDVRKAKEQARLAYQEALEENYFWLWQLESRLTTPGDDVRYILRYQDALAAVTREQVRHAIQTYLPRDRYVKITLYPEELDAKRGN
jgi:zinc protease